MKTPKVSVIMPAYNHEKYVGEAIESVLNQTFEDFEFIIINDGSTDGTDEVIRKYSDPRIRHYTQENQDAYNALNRGLSLAQGEYISIINSDDIYHPERIATLVSTVEADSVGFIITDVCLINGDSEPIQDENHPTFIWLNKLRKLYRETGSLELTLLTGNIALTTSNFFMTYDLYKKIGPFSPYHYSHDYDYVMRVLLERTVNIHFLSDQALLNYRVHSNNTIALNPLEALKQSFDILSSYVCKALHDESDQTKIHHFINYAKEVQAFARWQVSEKQRLLDEQNVTIANARAVIDNQQHELQEKNQSIAEKDCAIAEKDCAIAERDRIIADQNNEINRLNGQITNLLNSASWRLTEPLRKACSIKENVSVNLNHAREIYKIKTSKNNKPNVAIQLDAFDRGGLEEVVYSLIKGLDRDNTFNVYVFVNSEKLGYLGSKIRDEGTEVILLKNDEILLDKVIRRLNINIVSLHYSIFGVDIYAKSNVKMTYTIHNSYIWADELFIELRSPAYKMIDKFVAVSDQVKEYFVSRFDIAREKVTVIPNGLDLHFLGDIANVSREAFGLRAEDFVFLNVSSINWNKFHILMVAAMQQLIVDYPDFKLLFVGNVADSNCYDYIRNEIETNGLSDNVQIIDYIPKDKVLGLMKLSDCFVLPSLIEGWSIALMEAMYMELPLITSDIGSARNVIEGDDIGIIISNPYLDITRMVPSVIYSDFTNRNNLNNLPQLCKAMINIYNNRTNWNLKAKKGKEKIVKRFNSKQMTLDYMTNFNSLL